MSIRHGHIFILFILPFDLFKYYTQILDGLTATGLMGSYIQNISLEHILKITI